MLILTAVGPSENGERIFSLYELGRLYDCHQRPYSFPTFWGILSARYTNGGMCNIKCGFGFALAQSIKKNHSVWALFICALPFLGEPCKKHFHT